MKKSMVVACSGLGFFANDEGVAKVLYVSPELVISTKERNFEVCMGRIESF
jgi:hypothetical protein